MKKFKKILAVGLTVIIVISMMSFSVSASSAENEIRVGDKIEYVDEKGILREMEVKEVVPFECIPISGPRVRWGVETFYAARIPKNITGNEGVQIGDYYVNLDAPNNQACFGVHNWSSNLTKINIGLMDGTAGRVYTSYVSREGNYEIPYSLQVHAYAYVFSGNTTNSLAGAADVTLWSN